MKELFSAFIIVLFISASFSAFGQDWIRGSDNYSLCDTSIVRETAKDTVMIYNHNNKTSTFMHVAAGGAYPWTIYIEPIFVNDFEVFGKQVYFCGYRLDEGVKTAVFGYFHLPLFPNCTIYYYELDRCKELKKLDVYQTVENQFQMETHLVITGTTGTRSDAVLDYTMYSSSPVNCSLYISQDENESFDDVAVTKDYVVVSSRNSESGIPIIKFWYFDRPLLVGQNIFYSTIHSFRISSPAPQTPVILEHTGGNAYAAVYKEAGFSRMAMLKLSVVDFNYNIFEIMGDEAQTVFPIDIKYNTKNAVYAILARYCNRQQPTFLPPMQIYHVTLDDLAGITTNGHGTNYTEIYYHLWSLEPLRKTSGNFVVSGDVSHFPRLIRFVHDQWLPCSKRFDYYYNRGSLTGVINTEHILIYLLELNTIKHEPRFKTEIHFPVLCPQFSE